MLALLVAGPAAAEVTDGAVLSEVRKDELRFHAPGQTGLKLSCDGAIRPPKLGQVVRLRHHKGQLLGWEPLPVEAVRGRLHSLNVGKNRLSLKPREGRIQTWELAPHHLLLKELKSAKIYSLHRGELVVGLVHGGRLVTLYDAPSYLIGELSPKYGELLAWGRLSALEDSGFECEDARSHQRRRYSFSDETRWQLGAVFRSPKDFEGSECLVFGQSHEVRLVISRRAFPFALDRLP